MVYGPAVPLLNNALIAIAPRRSLAAAILALGRLFYPAPSYEHLFDYDVPAATERARKRRGKRGFFSIAHNILLWCYGATRLPFGPL